MNAIYIFYLRCNVHSKALYCVKHQNSRDLNGFQCKIWLICCCHHGYQPVKLINPHFTMYKTLLFIIRINGYVDDHCECMYILQIIVMPSLKKIQILFHNQKRCLPFRLFALTYFYLNIYINIDQLHNNTTTLLFRRRIIRFFNRSN